jgi:hypothetical protein
MGPYALLGGLNRGVRPPLTGADTARFTGLAPGVGCAAPDAEIPRKLRKRLRVDDPVWLDPGERQGGMV